MKRSLDLVLIVICAAALACKSAPFQSARRQENKVPADAVGRLTSLGYVGAAGAARQAGAPAAASTDPMLATTGAMKIEVKDVESAARDVQRLADGAGGFIGNANAGRNPSGSSYATLSMRIPTARVPSMLESLRALGKVMLETVTTEDVSKAYFDLSTRLRVKRGTEERLHGILATQTGRLSDVIDAEKELERVVGEIEEIEGQQHYYDGRVAMASLTVELTATDTTPKPGPFAAIGGAFRESREALVASVAGVIYVGAFLLPWLVVATLFFMLVRWARMRMRRRLA